MLVTYLQVSVSLAAAVSLQCHIASAAEPATAWAGHSCSFLCSTLRRQIQNLVSFKPRDSGQTHSDSDHATNLPKCQEKMNLKPSSYLVLHCINSFRQADSFKTSFNLHVIHGRLRSSTVAVKVLLCSMTSSCIDLIVSQIATKSSYALSALVKETEPVRIRQTRSTFKADWMWVFSWNVLFQTF